MARARVWGASIAIHAALAAAVGVLAAGTAAPPSTPAIEPRIELVALETPSPSTTPPAPIDLPPGRDPGGTGGRAIARPTAWTPHDPSPPSAVEPKPNVAAISRDPAPPPAVEPKPDVAATPRDPARPPAVEPKPDVAAIPREPAPPPAVEPKPDVAAIPRDPAPPPAREPKPEVAAIPRAPAPPAHELGPDVAAIVGEVTIDRDRDGAGAGTGSKNGWGAGSGGGVAAYLHSPAPPPPPPPADAPTTERSKARPARLVYPSRQVEIAEAELFVARLTIDDEGYVVGAKLARGFGGKRDEDAMAAVWRFRYEPALDDRGRPIHTVVDQHFDVRR